MTKLTAHEDFALTPAAAIEADLAQGRRDAGLPDYRDDAANIASIMARLVVERAVKPGVALAQEKYHLADGGLLLVEASWYSQPGEGLKLQWRLTPKRGAPPSVITPTFVVKLIAESLAARMG